MRRPPSWVMGLTGLVVMAALAAVFARRLNLLREDD
jgi:hypothetical protein